jgi:hypothetical protein
MWNTAALVMCVALAACAMDEPPMTDEPAVDADYAISAECLAEDDCEQDPEQTLSQCISACKGGAEAIRQFCRSLPDPRLRPPCFALEFVGQMACINWCYLQYG